MGYEWNLDSIWSMYPQRCRQTWEITKWQHEKCPKEYVLNMFKSRGVFVIFQMVGNCMFIVIIHIFMTRYIFHVSWYTVSPCCIALNASICHFRFLRHKSHGLVINSYWFARHTNDSDGRMAVPYSSHHFRMTIVSYTIAYVHVFPYDYNQ